MNLKFVWLRKHKCSPVSSPIQASFESLMFFSSFLPLLATFLSQPHIKELRATDVELSSQQPHKLSKLMACPRPNNLPNGAIIWNWVSFTHPCPPPLYYSLKQGQLQLVPWARKTVNCLRETEAELMMMNSVHETALYQVSRYLVY